MSLSNSKKTITQPYTILQISGENNKIKICSHIQKLDLKGNNNTIDGNDQNCKIDSIKINGNNNKAFLNQNCANVRQNVHGGINSISIGNTFPGINIHNDFIINNGNNRINNFNQAMDIFNMFGLNYMNMFNNMNYMFNMNNNSNNNYRNNNLNNYNMNNNNINNNNMNNNNLNNYMVNNIYSNNNFPNNNNLNNFRVNNNDWNNNFSNNNRVINHSNNNLNNNINNNRSNNNNNRNIQNCSNNNSNNNRTIKLKDIKNSIMASINVNTMSDFDKKKLELTLEMDEYQYKHIQKYESRKETECAICLNDFLGPDIIKAFYKCEHIFHKVCLLDWLKKSDSCPLCKHNLKDDIK